MGRAKDAVEVLQKVVDVREKVFQEGNRLLALSQADLALAFELDGEFDKAISMMQRAALAVRNCLPPTDHQRIATEKELDRMLNAYSNKLNCEEAGS